MPHTGRKKRKAAEQSAPPAQPPKRARKDDSTPSHALAISAYHAAEKRKAQATTPIARFKEQNDQTTLATYQAASLTGAGTGGETSQWLIKQLDGLFLGSERIRLLDVGAISGTAYTGCPRVDATSIDLHPQSEAVQQADFFAYAAPSPGEEFDIVCLSLVVNFVGSIEARGEMLRIAAQHLKPDGLIYLVLPLACVTNSRWLDHDRLRAIVRLLKYTVVKQHDTAKLTYWLLRWSGEHVASARYRKQPIKGKQSGQRNNFAIVLKPGR